VQCAVEQVRAEEAREALRTMLSRAGAVIERNGECDGDNRSLAQVRAGNFDLAAEMVRRGLAKTYDRHGPKPNWC
jgi:endonuclease YncB( thermonuclease family)